MEGFKGEKWGAYVILSTNKKIIFLKTHGLEGRRWDQRLCHERCLQGRSVLAERC